MLHLDHLAVTCTDLEAGVAFVEDALGITMGKGGVHPDMGTHNRLLSLGPDCYLEVIAIDPNASKPEHLRWFDLDAFTGPPTLSHWICRTADLEGALARAPDGCGVPLELQRGALRWRMAVPPTGRLPFDDTHPALISWQTDPPSLEDSQVRLKCLTIEHPKSGQLQETVQLRDPRVAFRNGPAKHLSAIFATSNGDRHLG